MSNLIFCRTNYKFSLCIFSKQDFCIYTPVFARIFIQFVIQLECKKWITWNSWNFKNSKEPLLRCLYGYQALVQSSHLHILVSVFYYFWHFFSLLSFGNMGIFFTQTYCFFVVQSVGFVIYFVPSWLCIL